MVTFAEELDESENSDATDDVLGLSSFAPILSIFLISFFVYLKKSLFCVLFLCAVVLSLLFLLFLVLVDQLKLSVLLCQVFLGQLEVLRQHAFDREQELVCLVLLYHVINEVVL